MSVKRNFKDSVFTKLFSDPNLLRELYCAICGVNLPPDIPVSINTLENVLYMDLYNDLSFEIGGKLVVLIEHSSTINPNMALRLYLYHSRVLEKIINPRSLYSSKRLSIPWPEFYVLYNGVKPYPEKETLKLSDLFEKPQDIGLPEKAFPLLELEVRVLNINEGNNGVILNRCKKLAEYSAFIAKAYTFLKESGNREEAIKKAVLFCQKHDILKGFLEIHASEVLNMLLTEWNMEDAIAVAREEAWEDGREERDKEIARKLKAMGDSTDKIHIVTGLEYKIIENL